MELGEFWANVHAVLLYDKEETTVFSNTDHADWKAADDAVSAFINSGTK